MSYDLLCPTVNCEDIPPPPQLLLKENGHKEQVNERKGSQEELMDGKTIIIYQHRCTNVSFRNIDPRSKEEICQNIWLSEKMNRSLGK